MSNNETVEALLNLIQTAARAAAQEYISTGGDVPSLSSTARHPLDSVLNNVALKRAIRVLEGACDQLCSMLAPPAHLLFNRGQDYYWSCLRVVTESNVADALAEHPDGLHITELSKTVGIEGGKLGGVLRLLATRNCFHEVTTDVFANNRLSIRLKSSDSLRDFVSMLSLEGPQAALWLYDNLADPECGPSYDPALAPFMYFKQKEEGFRGTFFEWQKTQPERRKVFGRAMVAMGDILASNAVLQNFPWQNYTTICDVGSGFGAFAIPLANTFPHVKLTLQDLPGTMEQAKQIWNRDCPQHVTSNRVSFVPMDFLVEQPVGGQDIYYLRNILHNWPDHESKLILKHVSGAMTPKSRLLIHEYVLQHVDRQSNEADSQAGIEVAPQPMLPNFGIGNMRMYNQDLVMLLMYNARERTLQQYIELGCIFFNLFDPWNVLTRKIGIWQI
ncbi:hypothetical protein AX16_002512 [Volvariella volvacea WC 439]|nr:hypothetical protein AX16_002512 [Volvariella volvacea WC 439]